MVLGGEQAVRDVLRRLLEAYLFTPPGGEAYRTIITWASDSAVVAIEEWLYTCPMADKVM